MEFVAGDPKLRIAVLYPGGLALSRNSGQDWIPLTGATGPIDLPTATFYDNNPGVGSPSLYMALLGRGVERIDGPFASLGAVQIELRGQDGGKAISFMDTSSGASIRLRQGPDGFYRGTELIDVSKTRTFRYRIVIDGQVSPEATRGISGAEVSSGVIPITLARVRNDVGRPRSLASP